MNEQATISRKTIVLMALSVVGFGFLQGARLIDLGTGPYSPEPFAIAGIAAGGATYLLLALLSYFGRLEETRPVFIASLVTMALRFALSFVPATSDAMILVSQVIAGIGWALIILCWMQVFTSYRPVYSLPMIAGGYIVDMLLIPLTNTLFSGDRHIALLVVVALSLVALGACLKNNETVAKSMIDDAAPKTSMAELTARTKRTIIGTLVFSASCGFIVQMDIVRNIEYAQTDLTAVIGLGVACIMCIALVIAKPQKANIDMAYPLATACLVGVLLYRSIAPSGDTLSGSLMVVLLITFFAMLWMTFVSEAHERKLPAFFLLGLAVGTAQLSIAAGRTLALSPLSAPLVAQPQLTLTCVIAVLAISLAIIFVSYLRFFTKSKELRYADAPDEMGDSITTSVGINDASLELLRETYGLTEREFQIIGEFSTGRSARYIADYYMLSEHTIKSHLRRAYAKMEIHSRQELLNLIDHMELSIHQRS